MLEEKVKRYLEQYHMLKAGDRVVIGVSGGADSVCLLLLLQELRREIGYRLTAVHVEHGIRGEESRRDAAFVETLCRDLGVDFLLYTVDAPEYRARSGQSLEEAARELRYDCFLKACVSHDANRLALAHQAEDCAETMLFHLSRGTGIRGLCGIRPVSERVFSGTDSLSDTPGEKREEGPAAATLTVIRPLLCATRPEITAWLAERGQDYCTDSTNADFSFSRNRIRQNVLPELVQINAQAVPHMQHLSEQLAEVSDFLDVAAREAGRDVFFVEKEDSEEGRAAAEEAGESGTAGKPASGVKLTISCARFLTLPEVLQSRLILQLLGLVAGSTRDFSSVHVEQVLRLMTAKVGTKSSLPHGITARKTYDAVRLCPESSPPETESLKACDLVIPGETVLENGLKFTAEVLEDFDFSQKIPRKSYTKWFDYDKINHVVQLRGRLPGDYLVADASGEQKKLRRYLIDEKVPSEARGRLCLVADGSHILWVVGYRISEAYKVTERTKRILCLCVSGTET